MSKLLLKISIAVGIGIAAYRGKTVLANAEFTGPIRAALNDAAYLSNCTVNGEPAIKIISKTQTDDLRLA